MDILTFVWVLGFSLISSGAGVFCRIFIPIPWLSWLLFLLFLLFALFMMLGARNETLKFAQQGQRFRYYIVGLPEEIAAFKAQTLRASGRRAG